MIQAGQYVTDGTAVFLVTDIRDGLQVGDIKLSPILRNGYVKANGALLTDASTNYPRLVTFVQENPDLLAADDSAWNSNKALYVYNSSADTLRVPDATGRVLQGGASVKSVEAGLPNITGVVNYSLYSSGGTWTGFSTQEITGAFYHAYSYPNASSCTNNGYYHTSYGTGFDASKSSSIYSNSTTVQSPALTMIPQIKY